MIALGIDISYQQTNGFLMYLQACYREAFNLKRICFTNKDGKLIVITRLQWENQGGE